MYADKDGTKRCLSDKANHGFEKFPVNYCIQVKGIKIFDK